MNNKKSLIDVIDEARFLSDIKDIDLSNYEYEPEDYQNLPNANAFMFLVRHWDIFYCVEYRLFMERLSEVCDLSRTNKYYKSSLDIIFNSDLPHDSFSDKTWRKLVDMNINQRLKEDLQIEEKSKFDTLINNINSNLCLKTHRNTAVFNKVWSFIEPKEKFIKYLQNTKNAEHILKQKTLKITLQKIILNNRIAEGKSNINLFKI